MHSKHLQCLINFIGKNFSNECGNEFLGSESKIWMSLLIAE